MYNRITSKLIAMWSIFKNDNDWNEKSIVGFIAFMIMCVFALLDLLTGYAGKDLVINETIYNAFTWIVIGCFGIAGAEKFAKK
tara:strand:- start:1689 stop:1937 length:249 start_codon:yes stop_codon:yes gene_type:complete